MEIQKQLLLHNSAVGRVEWIGIAAAPRVAIRTLARVRVLKDTGIDGDHHARPGGSSRRQVTLVQQEHLAVVAGLLQRDGVAPELLRRNIVVSGINLGALRHQRFRIGTAVLEGTGSCPPCSRMEENLGSGGYAAMLGHGGITAIVETEGDICQGDTVIALHD